MTSLLCFSDSSVCGRKHPSCCHGRMGESGDIKEAADRHVCSLARSLLSHERREATLDLAAPTPVDGATEDHGLIQISAAQ